MQTLLPFALKYELKSLLSKTIFLFKCTNLINTAWPQLSRVPN